MARSDRWMPSERQFTARGKDAYPVVGSWVGWRQNERRFREVRPVRKLRHLLVGNAIGVEHDGDGVPEGWLAGKDIDLAERAHAESVIVKNSSIESQLSGIGPSCEEIFEK